MHDSSDEQQEQEQGMDPRTFGLGLIVGAVVGASAALLLAPASGAKTRRKLRRGAMRLYSSSGELIGDVWEGAGQSSRRIGKTAGRSLRQVSRRGREYAEEAAELVGRGRRRFSSR